MTNIFSQEIPPILNYSSNAYGAENQNWAITQDDQEFIYVANNAGLLEYNGATWQLYPLPNATVVRSVLAIADRVYAGSFMEFGYWQEDEMGQKIYHSLSDQIKTELLEDEIFWNIKNLDQYILFQSYDRLYFYHQVTGQLTYQTDKKNYYRIFAVNQKIYIQKHNGYLYYIDNGVEKVLVQLPKDFDIKYILNIFVSGNELIILTRNEGFFKFGNGTLERWNIPAANFLKKSKVFSGIQLPDQRFVLGTISDGLVFLSPDGNITTKINQANGLSNNTVLNLFSDQRGNVWVALDNGLDCLNMRSFIREYNDKEGYVGTTYCSLVFDDKIYIGTNQGLFYKQPKETAPLKSIPDTKGQAWSLFVYEGTLFCGHNSGIFIIEEDQAKLITSVPGAWILRTLPDYPDHLIFGHYTGLGILSRKSGQWQFSHHLPNFKISSRFVEVRQKREVWINHEYKGVYRLKLSEDLQKLESIELIEDLPKGKGSGLCQMESAILYSYPEGVLRLSPAAETFVKDTTLSQLMLKHPYNTGKLIYDGKDRLWSFNQDNILYAAPSLLANIWDFKNIPIENTFRKTIVSFENIAHLKANEYLIGKSNGYLTVDLDKIEPYYHKIYLDQVTYRRQNGEVVSLARNIPEELTHKQNSMNFYFSVPNYSKYENVNFQYQLTGSQEDWSEWMTTPMLTFEKLTPGDYQFKVRSRIGEQRSENVATYEFTIKTPFYLSNAAWLAYLSLGVLLIYFTHQYYNRFYRLQNEKLIQGNQRLMDLQRIQNEQELTTLKNAKLNQEIDSKNRELAISAMSIVKRNEVLRNIKKELKNDPSLADKSHPVFKLIEKNLNNSKDQQFFMDAFDNADKDFLKRAKSIHPALTPNDLKFCAYLRLNITSKEIAPLLNISVKSVEVRRSRLRKKLILPRETNLIDYILSI